MSKKHEQDQVRIKELEHILKRERLDSIEADKQWQAKVSQLRTEIRALELKVQILENNKEI